MRPPRFRCKMSGVAMYQGRALAEINLSGRALARRWNCSSPAAIPSLGDIQLKRATPTGDLETRVEPHKRWFEVVFEVEDNPDEEEDEDPDTFAARKKAEAKARAAEKARVKDWRPGSQGVFPT